MTKEKQNISKICFFDKTGKVSHMIVFSGEKNTFSFSSFSKPEIFSVEEWNLIQETKIPIYYSSLLIHMDDSIYTIKEKITYASRVISQQNGTNIMDQINSNDQTDTFSFPEFNTEDIYLFGVCSCIFNPLSFYKQVTYNERNALSQNILKQVLTNLSEIDEKMDEKINAILEDTFFIEKEEFTYDDLLHFDLFLTESKSRNGTENRLYKTQIGHRYIQKGANKSKGQGTGQGTSGSNLMYSWDPLFASNPFDLLSGIKPTFQISSKQDLVVSSHDFLFQYTGNKSSFLNDTIYVCLAKDVLRYASMNKIDESYILRMYYPLLWEKDIISLSDLEKPLLWRESSLKKTMDLSQLEEYKKVDIFTNIYYRNTSKINYIQQGIKSFYLILHPETNTLFPLETLFKNIHVNKTIPFIQYNPGSKQEHLFRVYYEELSQNGKKIPFLSKDTISSLLTWKPIVKTQSIILFISQEDLSKDLSKNVSKSTDFIQIVLEKNDAFVIKTSTSGSLDIVLSVLENAIN